MNLTAERIKLLACGFIALLFVVGVYVYQNSDKISLNTGSATISGPSLSVSSSSANITVGHNFTVDINLDTQSQAIQGAEVFYLRFDPALLEVIDSNTSAAGVQIVPGTLMAQTVGNIVDNTNGKIAFQQIIIFGSAPFTGSGKLASVTFRAKAAGSANVNFDYTAGSTTDSNIVAGGQDILAGVVNGTFVLSNPTALSCSASSSSVGINTDAVFTATGGSGNFSWTGGGTPATGGNSATFTTKYATTGTKTVTVNRGSGSATCSVTVADTMNPAVSAFDVNPKASNSDFTASFTVTDAGGSHLKQVELYRSDYLSSGCKSGDTVSCTWTKVDDKNAPANRDSWTSTMTDNPAPGQYVYGLHVFDNANNEGSEVNVVEVAKTNPGSVSDVTFDPTSTTFTISISVTLSSSTSGASIKYTLDGSDPKTSSTAQTFISGTPIALTNTTTIKSYATKSGLDSSDVTTATYTKETTPTLSCATASSQATINTDVTFTATGGGTTYTWTGGGSPATGSGSTFVTKFGSLGNKTVTVVSGAHTNTCSVVVVPAVVLAGDLNGDGKVDGADITLLVGKWFSNDAGSDLNDDGLVNSIDYSILNDEWTN